MKKHHKILYSRKLSFVLLVSMALIKIEDISMRKVDYTDKKLGSFVKHLENISSLNVFFGPEKSIS